jgi:integrase/recombinase XerD
MIQESLIQFIHYLTYEKKLSKNTITAYVTDLNQFKDHCPQKIESVGDCLRYVTQLHEHHYQPATLKRKISATQSFLDFLYHDAWIATKIILPISSPKSAKKLPKILEKPQINTLIATKTKNSKTPLRDQLIITLLYKCGLRVDECIHLKIDNISSDSTIKVLGKRNKERILPISKSTLNLIKTYINTERAILQKTQSPYLLLNPRGLTLTRQGIKFILNKDKIMALTPHTLRHSFATHLIEKDVSIREVQELLGHHSIVTTQKYTQICTSKRKSVYESAHPRSNYARKTKKAPMLGTVYKQRKNKV